MAEEVHKNIIRMLPLSKIIIVSLAEEAHDWPRRLNMAEEAQKAHTLCYVKHNNKIAEDRFELPAVHINELCENVFNT